MGLLKGAGRRLKGLLGDGGLVDTLDEARAWLEGDYERGITLALRDRRRRKPRIPAPWDEQAWLAQHKGALPAKPDPTLVDGTIIEEPLTKSRMIFAKGEWKPWKL